MTNFFRAYYPHALCHFEFVVQPDHQPDPLPGHRPQLRPKPQPTHQPDPQPQHQPDLQPETSCIDELMEELFGSALPQPL